MTLDSRMNPEVPDRLYTDAEEVANTLTHGCGAFLSLIGAIYLVILAVKQGSSAYILAFSIYGFTLVILYLASTFYHSIHVYKLKKVFQKIDHGAIYVLIAGTHTPFLILKYPGEVGWVLLGIVWTLAIIGIGYKAFLIHRHEKLSAIGYIFMSGVFVLGGKQILLSFPQSAMLWIVAGGFFYLIGLLFAAWKMPYFHTIWHVFVMAGSVCHYMAVVSLLPAS
jgi:hemolysin III